MRGYSFLYLYAQREFGRWNDSAAVGFDLIESQLTTFFGTQSELATGSSINEAVCLLVWKMDSETRPEYELHLYQLIRKYHGYHLSNLEDMNSEN